MRFDGQVCTAPASFAIARYPKRLPSFHSLRKSSVRERPFVIRCCRRAERIGERFELDRGLEAERVRAEKVEVERDDAVRRLVEDEVHAGVGVLVDGLAVAELVMPARFE